MQPFHFRARALRTQVNARRVGRPRWAHCLLLASLATLLGACQHGGGSVDAGDGSEAIEAEQSVSESDRDQQTAYRVRGDFLAPLNAADGWSAATNTPAAVTADQPFRLRFEVEAPGSEKRPRRYQLEYRRNGGAWQTLLAENFPQPAKEVELDFAGKPEGPLTDRWELLSGAASDLSWEDTDEAGYLRLEAEAEPLLALGRYSHPWEAVEFAAILRLQGEYPNGAGIVFAYQDALNYQRLEFTPEGSVAIVQVENGEASSLARESVEPIVDAFVEIKLIREGSDLIVEYGEAGEVLTASYPEPVVLGRLGVYLSERSGADFESFVIEGAPRTPRTSIVASHSFEQGAPTTDSLAVSERPFSGGAGISFSKTTPDWLARDSQGEWEFPLVIRYFSDEAVMNQPGDRFEYRLVDASGAPLVADTYATVSLEVPAGHLGGVFVETPMRIGPWQASDGALYFLMEPSETWNSLMAVKSVDGGRSWREVDGVHRPATGDLEGFASVLVGDQIHMLHQTSDDVLYHVFNTSDHPELPDSWAVRDEWLASPIEPPTQVADLAVRSDGSIVAVYGGPEKIHTQTRSATGVWGPVTILDSDRPPALSGPSLTLGASDVVHLAYTGSDGSAWYRRILPDGEITERVQFASDLGTHGDDVGSILPLVYLEGSDAVSILYRSAEGHLWERRVEADGAWSDPLQVTDRVVVQNAVDSEQTGADAVAFRDSVQVLFIEETSGHLYHTERRNGGDWAEPTLLVGEGPVQWVRGSIIQTTDGRAAYGYVIDTGADGGSGKNQFGQIYLEAD